MKFRDKDGDKIIVDLYPGHTEGFMLFCINKGGAVSMTPREAEKFAKAILSAVGDER
jgi:hypothetical protein